jgi:hypothetical protein
MVTPKTVLVERSDPPLGAYLKLAISSGSGG